MQNLAFSIAAGAGRGRRGNWDKGTTFRRVWHSLQLWEGVPKCIVNLGFRRKSGEWAKSVFCRAEPRQKNLVSRELGIGEGLNFQCVGESPSGSAIDSKACAYLNPRLGISMTKSVPFWGWEYTLILPFNASTTSLTMYKPSPEPLLDSEAR